MHERLKIQLIVWVLTTAVAQHRYYCLWGGSDPGWKAVLILDLKQKKKKKVWIFLWNVHKNKEDFILKRATKVIMFVKLRNTEGYWIETAKTCFSLRTITWTSILNVTIELFIIENINFTKLVNSVNVSIKSDHL